MYYCGLSSSFGTIIRVLSLPASRTGNAMSE
jgi:hypothetical protein